MSPSARIAAAIVTELIVSAVKDDGCVPDTECDAKLQSHTPRNADLKLPPRKPSPLPSTPDKEQGEVFDHVKEQRFPPILNSVIGAPSVCVPRLSIPGVVPRLSVGHEPNRRPMRSSWGGQSALACPYLNMPNLNQFENCQSVPTSQPRINEGLRVPTERPVLADVSSRWLNTFNVGSKFRFATEAKSEVQQMDATSMFSVASFNFGRGQ